MFISSASCTVTSRFISFKWLSICVMSGLKCPRATFFLLFLFLYSLPSFELDGEFTGWSFHVKSVSSGKDLTPQNWLVWCLFVCLYLYNNLSISNKVRWTLSSYCENCQLHALRKVHCYGLKCAAICRLFWVLLASSVKETSTGVQTTFKILSELQPNQYNTTGVKI